MEKNCDERVNGMLSECYGEDQSDHRKNYYGNVYRDVMVVDGQERSRLVEWNSEMRIQ